MESTSLPSQDLRQRLVGQAREASQQYVEHVKAEPVPNMLYALGVGYVLRCLPLAAIFGLLFSLLVRLIKPTILVLAILKVIPHLRRLSKE